jgi:hypothetical protein
MRESPPQPAPQPGPTLEERKQQALALWSGLTLGSKVLLVGGSVGVVLTFLPIFTASSTVMGISSSGSAAAFDGWQGKLGLLGFLGSAFFGWYLCRSPKPSNFKNLLYAALGCAALAGLMSLWVFWDVSRVPSVQAELKELAKEVGKAVKASSGVTLVAYLYLAAGLAVLAGGALRAKEEKLF